MIGVPHVRYGLDVASGKTAAWTIQDILINGDPPQTVHVFRMLPSRRPDQDELRKLVQ